MDSNKLLIIAIDYDDVLFDGVTGKLLDLSCVSVIKKWLSDGHNCYILTGRHKEDHLAEVRDKLCILGLDLHVYSCGSYDMSRKLGYEWDVLIDDSKSLLAVHQESGDNRVLVHFNKGTSWSNINLVINEITRARTLAHVP